MKKPSQINLVPRAFPLKNGPPIFLREKPWGRGWSQISPIEVLQSWFINTVYHLLVKTNEEEGGLKQRGGGHLIVDLRYTFIPQDLLQTCRENCKKDHYKESIQGISLSISLPYSLLLHFYVSLWELLLLHELTNPLCAAYWITLCYRVFPDCITNISLQCILTTFTYLRPLD